MPKMKSKRALMKRIKVTGSGKVTRHHAYTSHLAPHKTTKQKRHLMKGAALEIAMRVKGGTVTHARRKKMLKRASGYFGSKHLLYKTAKEQVMHSLRYAYISRRTVKRDYRKLWIRRINAACRMNDISYSKFMYGLKVANIQVNRKMLSELAINDPSAFADLVKTAKNNIK